MTEQLPITAIVVSRNEATLLRRCLPTIGFCDEILVVDLESTDDTGAVATEYGATVIRRPLEPTVERVRFGVFDRAANDWVLTTDPDEQLPPALAAVVAETLPSLADDVALVYAPIRYHFGGRPLRGTTWGGERYRRLLVRRSGVEPSTRIYGGVSPRPASRTIELPYTAETAIVHQWSPGYRTLIAKHRRYLRASAEDRARAGEVTGWRKILTMPWHSFRESFVHKQGWRDGVTGLFLSVFWAWFTTRSELALRQRLRSPS